MSHVFAVKYGWTLDYTRSLSVVDAMNMMKEIEDQAEREELALELARSGQR